MGSALHDECGDDAITLAEDLERPRAASLHGRPRRTDAFVVHGGTGGLSFGAAQPNVQTGPSACQEVVAIFGGPPEAPAAVVPLSPAAAPRIAPAQDAVAKKQRCQALLSGVGSWFGWRGAPKSAPKPCMLDARHAGWMDQLYTFESWSYDGAVRED